MNVVKYLIIVHLLIIGSFGSNCRLYSQVTHIFGTTEFYSLKLNDSIRYELEIGMYGKGIVSGEYECKDDTLKLITLDFINTSGHLTERDKNIVINNYRNYLMKDSLIMPITLLELNPPRPKFISIHEKRDSINSDWYILSDGHVYYQIKLRKDSLFTYYTGACRGKIKIEGKWLIDKNELMLIPNSKDRIEPLSWICSDYKLEIYKNLLIGRNVKENEYTYLLKR